MSTQSSSSNGPSVSLKYAETVTERVQDALWEGLKAYDQVMEQDCPEDEYDPAHEHVQDVTLITRIAVLGEVLGYDMEAAVTLIEDYHHHECFQSGRIDEARRSEYDRLHEWLSLDQRTTPFQDIVITGFVCQFGNERGI